MSIFSSIHCLCNHIRYHSLFLIYLLTVSGLYAPMTLAAQLPDPSPILPPCQQSPDSISNLKSKILNGAVTIPVLYATNRKQVGNKLDKNGSTIGSLHFGSASVTVPIKSKWLQENIPLLNKRLEILGWTYSSSLKAQQPYIEERGYVAEKKSQNLVKLTPEKDFWQSLDVFLGNTAADELFVYIHGFASSGTNAIYSAGVLASHLEAPVVCFTWPSLGIVGLKGKIPLLSKNTVAQNFKRDKEIIDDPRVCADMNRVMDQLKRHVGKKKRISIIAHSLGNRLLVGHLNQHTNSPVIFKRLILIAPDVNRDLFSNSLDNILSHSEYVAVFTNPKDKVLLASSMRDLFAERNRTKKLGKSKGYVPGIDYVNYSAVAQPRGLKYLSLRHYIPFEHLAGLLKSGTPAHLDNNEHFVLVNRRVIQKVKTPLSAPNSIGLGEAAAMKCQLLDAQKLLKSENLHDRLNCDKD